MKKIPKLYTKNSKGRYQEYKIPDLDISKTFYRKINGKYEPVSMLSYSPLEEGVWVVKSIIIVKSKAYDTQIKNDMANHP